MLTIFLTNCSITNKTVQLRNPIPNPTQITHDTIPFEVTEGNNIKFKTILNGKDTIDLFFDTGGTELVLLKDAIENQTTLLQNESADFVLENYTPLTQSNRLEIGTMTFDSLTVYPFPVGPEDMAGHFGWDLFENKIVELDYDNKLMMVHSNSIPIPNGYSKLNIEYTHTLFCVQGSTVVDGKSFTNRYLFDTGFQRAIVLDKDLRAKENFPTDLEVIKESKLRNSEGTLFVNQVVIADQFCFGDICADKIPTQLFNTPNPARFETHILGNEILKRFNTIFDFQNGVIYLKPNSLIGLPYSDAS